MKFPFVANLDHIGGSMARVLVLVDTPNISRSVLRKYGDRCRADYGRLYQMAISLGRISRACALVNDGVSPRFIETLQRVGFEPRQSHAFDCDDALVAHAVRFHRSADIFILCSGDKHYGRLVEILSAVGVKVIICAVEGSCSGRLKSLSSDYLEMPVRDRVPNQNRQPRNADHLTVACSEGN